MQADTSVRAMAWLMPNLTTIVIIIAFITVKRASGYTLFRLATGHDNGSNHPKTTTAGCCGRVREGRKVFAIYELCAAKLMRCFWPNTYMSRCPYVQMSRSAQRKQRLYLSPPRGVVKLCAEQCRFGGVHRWQGQGRADGRL